MDPEQSSLRSLHPDDPSDNRQPQNHHLIDPGGGDTSSNSQPVVDDVSDRMNSDPITVNYQDNNDVTVTYYIDNNDNSGMESEEFISVEYISNCQEESDIQLEDSLDNNSNVSMEMSKS